MRAVNLLPAERRKGGEKSGSKTKLTPVHGAALAILLGAGALGYWGHGIRGEVATQKQQFAELEAQSSQLQADIAIAKAAQGAQTVSTFEVDRNLVVGLTTARVNWSAVMINLSRVAPSGVWLESIAVTNPSGDAAAAAPGAPRTPAITLKARATSRTNAALFLSRLSAIPGFDQPRLNGGIDPENADSSATGATSAPVYVFTVEIPVDDGLVRKNKVHSPAPAAAPAAPATTTPPSP